MEGLPTNPTGFLASHYRRILQYIWRVAALVLEDGRSHRLNHSDRPIPSCTTLLTTLLSQPNPTSTLISAQSCNTRPMSGQAAASALMSRRSLVHALVSWSGVKSYFNGWIEARTPYCTLHALGSHMALSWTWHRTPTFTYLYCRDSCVHAFRLQSAGTLASRLCTTVPRILPHQPCHRQLAVAQPQT
jgi:hypothetical protein